MGEHTRVDDWYWLRDRDNPEVMAYLEAENAYEVEQSAHLVPLRQTLYDEMLARIVQTDLSVPLRKGNFWYYSRTIEGKNYPVSCRRAVTDAEPPTIDPLAEPGADGEEILLDQNALADGHEYFALGAFEISPDDAWLAYSIDTDGGELYDLHFQRLDGSSAIANADETIAQTYYGSAFSLDSGTIFYTRVDDAMRPFQLWRHRLGTDPGDDVVVLEESDARFSLGVGRLRDDSFIVVGVSSTMTDEIAVIPADAPESELVVIAPRRQDHEYSIEHWSPAGSNRGYFVITTNTGAPDRRLVVVSDDDPDEARWVEVLAERPGTRIDGVDVFEQWLVISERFEGDPVVRLIPLDGTNGSVTTGPFAGDLLGRSRLIRSASPPASTWLGANADYAVTSLRYEQTSLSMPRQVVDLDLVSDIHHVRKRQEVLGGYEPDDYVTMRLWAPAADGTEIPISLIGSADLFDGGHPRHRAPLLLYGYGSYEICIDPTFSALRLSLLERGVIYAIAHIRGGGELGRRWYEEGKLANKTNTFSDFIACARHLIDLGMTSADQLAIRGGSAGGLLMGAVVNAAPDLWRAVVAEVPFVDCLTTICDPDLPLTVNEWEEWGNPLEDAEIYDLMASYAPYENVASLDDKGQPLRYPDLFITAGLNDPRVSYWEPAKWTAKLRAANPENRVLLRTDLTSGHGGPSGRYDSWQEEARVFAFVLDALGAA